MTIEFVEFPKIKRLNQKVVVTEKIDGTNACVVIDEEGNIGAQSRNRLIQVGNDNFGFAGWVAKNKDELLKLGPGHHYGEWWGLGIGRGYNLTERRFSLFNAARWGAHNPNTPACCRVVPVISMDATVKDVPDIMELLKKTGSFAEVGFMNPEGVIVYHQQSRDYSKVTFDFDKGKWSEAAA